MHLNVDPCGTEIGDTSGHGIESKKLKKFSSKGNEFAYRLTGMQQSHAQREGNRTGRYSGNRSDSPRFSRNFYLELFLIFFSTVEKL